MMSQLYSGRLSLDGWCLKTTLCVSDSFLIEKVGLVGVVTSVATPTSTSPSFESQGVWSEVGLAVDSNSQLNIN